MQLVTQELFAFLENIEPSDELEKIVVGNSPINTGFSSYTEVELNDMLQKALEEEDYEKAARIRDELSKRQ